MVQLNIIGSIILQLESRLNSIRFVGCIEDVMLDDVSVGLWNFAQGQNNYKGCLGR